MSADTPVLPVLVSSHLPSWFSVNGNLEESSLPHCSSHSWEHWRIRSHWFLSWMDLESTKLITKCCLMWQQWWFWRSHPKSPELLKRKGSLTTSHKDNQSRQGFSEIPSGNLCLLFCIKLLDYHFERQFDIIIELMDAWIIQVVYNLGWFHTTWFRMRWYHNEDEF